MRARMSEQAARDSHARAGFTLIELMVVVGIIGLLVSIALPAFSNILRQSKRTATAATIHSIDIGIESYRTDTQVGGSYPPSVQLPADPWIPASPYGVAGGKGGSAVRFCGANLVAWALVGADLLGTPGFRNIDGQTDPFGGWISDTSNVFNTQQSGLYALYPASDPVQPGKPYWPRSGPYVDISKMAFPTKDPVAGGAPTFTLDKLGTKPKLYSICFLDAWGQPILYYKANTGASAMASCGGKQGGYNIIGTSYVPNGVYDLIDNSMITGPSQDPLPMDLGAGSAHPLAAGWSLPAAIPGPPPNDAPAPRGSFGYTVWNRTVTATWRPYRDDSFLLLSAGPDGLFGTADDVANAPLFDNK